MFHKFSFSFQKKNLLSFISDHTKVCYFINVPNLASFKKSDLEDLRTTIILLLNANYDEVIVSGVQEGSVIVIFMIKNCLISLLIGLFKSEKIKLNQNIFKVMIQDDVVFSKGIFSNNILWKNINKMKMSLFETLMRNFCFRR